MVLTQRTAKGGVANSEFTVYPVFTFTRQGDKAEKTLDVGASDLGAESAKRLTLRAKNIPWTTGGHVGSRNHRPCRRLRLPLGAQRQLQQVHPL